MSEIINISEVMPPTGVLNFADLHRITYLEHLGPDSTFSDEFNERYTSIPPEHFEVFVDLFPDKIVGEDYRVFDAVNALAQTLETRNFEPVLVVNDHEVIGLRQVGNNPPEESISTFTAVSYGFSGGAHFKSYMHRFIASGKLTLCLNAPQTMIYNDGFGVNYASSFPVSRWDLQPLQHFGAFVLERDIDFSTINDSGSSYAVNDKAGKIMIGNGAIQEYIETRPELTEVIDGCRDAYRNEGVNPLIGQQIAKAFNLDHLSDKEKKQLRWI